MTIECNYELPTLLRDLLGAEYISLHTRETSFHFAKDTTAMVLFPMRLVPQYYYWEKKAPIIIELQSKGQESFAGNLYGITAGIMELENARQTDNIYSTRLAFFGPVTQIVGLGEIRNEDLATEGKEEDIAFFLPAGTIVPDTLSIRKKTLEVIGFGLASGKWLYIHGAGEGSFTLSINETRSPEELCLDEGYTLNEKKMQVLEIFKQ